MKRSTTAYIVILAVSAVGLWVLLALGESRRAPIDLRGSWDLVPDISSGASAARPRKLVIDQSGRYLHLSFDGGKPSSHRLSIKEDSPREQCVELVGDYSYLLIRHVSEVDDLLVEVGRVGSSQGAIAYRARRTGDANLLQSPGGSPAAELRSARHIILIILLDVAIILAASQLMGYLFARIGQPKVVGEMAAGIMLGPSLLGLIFPETSAALFPMDAVRYLGMLSQFGVIFFLFLVGLELDPKLLRHRGRAAVMISHISIVAPFLLGGALALYLYPRVFNDAPAMRFNSVALFMGAAMSITAFPVLARILTERNLHQTQVGAVTITCAAVDDVTAWCILAFVVAFARTSGLSPAVATAILSAVYVAFMFLVVRPLLGRLQTVYERQGQLSRGVMAAILLLVLASASATEAIGIHPLFGAFLIGALMPKKTNFVRDLREKLEDFTVLLLLPIFFAHTGLKTRIGLLSAGDLWILTALVIFVACLGKFGGSTIAARACGFPWREASAIGILMNTRGLMELVILTIGRELGVITDAVFAMMILMALVTTFLTTPILNGVYPERLLRTRPSPTPQDQFGILIPVSRPRSALPLVLIADMISSAERATRKIFGLHLRPAQEHEAYRAAARDTGETPKVLESLVTQAAAQGVELQPLSYVSLDAAADIVQSAADRGVRLILMGFRNPVIGQALLGGIVHRVLDTAQTDVGILVDRGMKIRPKTILVPYLGSRHDRLALDFGARMARNAGAAVTVLHIVPPGRDSGSGARLDAKVASDQVFADPSQPAPVTFRVIEHADPITAVLEQARPFDLVVIGVGEEWGLTSHLIGWRAERIARDCPSPLLILRRHPCEPGP